MDDNYIKYTIVVINLYSWYNNGYLKAEIVRGLIDITGRKYGIPSETVLNDINRINTKPSKLEEKCQII